MDNNSQSQISLSDNAQSAPNDQSAPIDQAQAQPSNQDQPPYQGQPPSQGQPPFQGQPPPQGQPPFQGQPPSQEVQWMTRPELSECPPGLEYLTQVDQLIVKQQINLTEIMIGIEMNNVYWIRNNLGQMVYKATEDILPFYYRSRGSRRPFTIRITDNFNSEVLTIRRLDKCSCYSEVEVKGPTGATFGFVKEESDGFQVNYAIMNENLEIILRIEGISWCCYEFRNDIEFKLMPIDGGTQIGRISKQWTNLVQELFTDADNYGVQFPIDLDVKMKAVVLGAVFLVDFMFFESSSNHKRHAHHGYGRHAASYGHSNVHGHSGPVGHNNHAYGYHGHGMQMNFHAQSGFQSSNDQTTF